MSITLLVDPAPRGHDLASPHPGGVATRPNRGMHEEPRSVWIWYRKGEFAPFRRDGCKMGNMDFSGVRSTREMLLRALDAHPSARAGKPQTPTLVERVSVRISHVANSASQPQQFWPFAVP